VAAGVLFRLRLLAALSKNTFDISSRHRLQSEFDDRPSQKKASPDCNNSLPHSSAPPTTSNMPKRSSHKRRSSRRRHESSSSPPRHRRRRSHRHRDRTPSRGRRSHRRSTQNVSATPVTPESLAALVSASVTTATKSILNSIRSTPSRRLFAESRDGQLLRNPPPDLKL